MIEEWQDAFIKAQSTAHKMTSLIEHRSSEANKLDKVEMLENSIVELKKQNERSMELEEKRSSRIKTTSLRFIKNHTRTN